MRIVEELGEFGLEMFCRASSEVVGAKCPGLRVSGFRASGLGIPGFRFGVGFI